MHEKIIMQSERFQTVGSGGGLCCFGSTVVGTTIHYLWVDSVSFWNMTHSNSDGLDFGWKV